MTKLVVPELPNDGKHYYLVLSGTSWAGADTIAAAKKRLAVDTKRPAQRVLVVPKGAWINELGNQIIWEHSNGHGAGFCPRCVVK